MKRSNLSNDVSLGPLSRPPEISSPVAASDTSTPSVSPDVIPEAKPKKSSPRAKQSVPEPRGQFESSVEPLTLPKGLYLFSALNASPTQVGSLVLPAIQVGAGPGTNDQLEMMCSPGMNGVWLCKPDDKMVLKIKSLTAALTLTSIRTKGMVPLVIEVQRLDAQGEKDSGKNSLRSAKTTASLVSPSSNSAEVVAAVTYPTPESDSRQIPLRIIAHIQNRGDVQFVSAPWAGFAGQRLAIEGFSLSPLSKIPASGIEYKALTLTRSETPWISEGALCGSRGKGLPLVGFSIRIKPQADGKQYDAEYSGTFASGKVIGPVRNGAPCWSVASGDFLEALQVKIIERD